MNRRLLDYGEYGLLVECLDLADALALRAALAEADLPQITEMVPGAQTLLLKLSLSLGVAERRLLLTLEPGSTVPAESALVRIEVTYDGEDLAEVAELTGLTPDGVVQAHTDRPWTVGFCGFAPGFAYLQPEHDRLRVPRRSSPRTRVPSGSVGLADQWSGIYPREGPAGWQLIGRTDARLWDLEQSPPARLQPGMQVQFVAVGPTASC